MSSQSLPPLLSHPLTAFALSLTQCVLTLGFTSQDSPLRPLGLAPMLAYVYLALRTSQTHRATTHQLYLSMLTGSTASMALQYLDSALLSRWTYTARGPTSALGGQKNLRHSDETGHHHCHRSAGHTAFSSSWSRLVFGWEEAFRARSARSPWEVKNVPSFDPGHPDAVPTKAQFLRRTALRALLSLFVVDVIGYLGRDASMNAVHFARGRIPVFARWRSVTGEELVLRLVSSVLNWATFVCLLQALYDGAAIAVMGLGWGRIERWPPLFNRWTECWSVRRFWGYVTTKSLLPACQTPSSVYLLMG
ncbi:MAG: hypothetical protein Q9184_008338 [Pyrenodesmia sp. 2 TL-2023]